MVQSKSKTIYRKSRAKHRPLTIHRMILPVPELLALNKGQRTAILLLGHLLNEANWLRKLLVIAAMHTDDTVDGQANFALAVQLATTLAGKVHEGWQKVHSGALSKTIHSVIMPHELQGLRKVINRPLNSATISTIRNTYSFHYPVTLMWTAQSNRTTSKRVDDWEA